MNLSDVRKIQEAQAYLEEVEKSLLQSVNRRNIHLSELSGIKSDLVTLGGVAAARAALDTVM